MRARNLLVRGVVFGVVAGLFLTSPANALQVGEQAPDFTLAASGGKQVRLANLLGKGPVVIYTFVQAFAGL